MLNKRAQGAAVGVIIAIIVIIIIIAAIVNWDSGHECEKDTDCGSEQYCNVHHECVQIPVIERTIVEYNLVLPSIIIGFAIIIAALLLRRKRNKPTKNSSEDVKLRVYNRY